MTQPDETAQSHRSRLILYRKMTPFSKPEAASTLHSPDRNASFYR
ncbi:MAG: hypothetical protein SVX43_07590 [Cyanobacteriota bacterium]|nr:hypothetical protein [Cyanobacteriota bacterium]